MSQLLFFIIFFQTVAVLEIIETNDERIIAGMFFLTPVLCLLSCPVGIATLLIRILTMFVIDRMKVSRAG